MPKKRFENVMRVSETELDGSKKVEIAIRNIKGISFRLSRAIGKLSGLGGKLLKDLSDNEIKKLEDVIKEPKKFGTPSWMLNRRKDMDSGVDVHLTESDLDLAKRGDIDRMKKIRCYKGVRHQLGLPVRGQRTRSSFRTKATVGVLRKAVKAKMQAKAEEKPEKKK